MTLFPCEFLGHTFAQGGFFALAHDHRIMRVDRGWFCLSEVHVGVPISITDFVGKLLV